MGDGAPRCQPLGGGLDRGPSAECVAQSSTFHGAAVPAARPSPVARSRSCGLTMFRGPSCSPRDSFVKTVKFRDGKTLYCHLWPSLQIAPIPIDPRRSFSKRQSFSRAFAAEHTVYTAPRYYLFGRTVPLSPRQQVDGLWTALAYR